MWKKSIFLALAVFAWSSIAFADSSPVGEFVEGEVLVLFEGTGASSADISVFNSDLESSAKAIASSVGARSLGTFSAIAAQTGRNIAHLSAEGKTTAELMDELKSQPGVIGVAPNYLFRASVTPNDPYYTGGNLWGMSRIGGSSAWDISSGDRGVFVAVLDTGIKNDHVDLSANMGVDKDGNWGKNLITSGALPIDDNGHGTHVAGTIGAMGNNGIGVVGVNWSVSLLAVKVLDSQGSGTGSQIMAGLDYVVAQKQRGLNIKVANMSLGGWGAPIYNLNSDPYAVTFKAVSDAGIVLVVAAGNEGQDIDNPGWYDHPTQGWINLAGQRPYPACFPFANMITVGSIASNSAMSDFSNYSPNFVQLAAPGSGIWSTSYTGGYESMNGTSMATPHVAGAAALIAAASPTATAREIKARILANVNSNANISSKFYTKGDLNLLTSVRNDVGFVPATGIAVSTSAVSLGSGGTVQLSASVSPANATNRMVGWSSNNPSVATVSGTGLVKAVSAGTAVISAWSNDGGLISNATVSVTGGSILDGGGGCSIGLAPATLLLALPLLFLSR